MKLCTTYRTDIEASRQTCLLYIKKQKTFKGAKKMRSLNIIKAMLNSKMVHKVLKKNFILNAINIVMITFLILCLTFGITNENITLLLYTVPVIWFTLFFVANKVEY